MRQLLSVDDAVARVLERVAPVGAERAPLAEACGRVLAEDAHAGVDLPPFPSSAMDGFAVRAADAPGPLRVTGAVAAGRPAAGPVAAGEAVQIATGGVVPDGADTVVPVEVATSEDGLVTVPPDVVAGDNVRPRAGDVAAGEVVAARGSVLTAPRLAALAAAGADTVVVARRPRATVVATGTELRRPGERLRPGEIYESNGLMLEAALADAGAVVASREVVADDAEAHRAALADALEGDVVVTSGGVSVGPHDLVRSVLAGLGVEEVFWGVAMRPGKPIAFGVRGSTLVFGLPGNPVSSLVGFLLFVRPAVRALQADAAPGPSYLPGVLGADVRRNPARDDFVRAVARWDGDTVQLDPVTGQESHMIVRGAAADAIVRVRCGDGTVRAGTPVRYLPL